MSNVLYTVNSRETLFDGKFDIEDMRKEADCWYEGATFWQDWETDDPEARLLYKIFQNY